MPSRKEIQEAVNKLEEQTRDEMMGTMKELMEKGFNKNLTPKDSLQLSNEVMETIYSHGYTLYNTGRYSESGYIFRLLIMLDYMESKYQMGLAACLHMEKRYLNAAQLYMMTAILAPGNPLPYYHAADCFIQIGSPSSATFMLQMAIEEADEKAEFGILTERCRMMKESLRESAEEEEKAGNVQLLKTVDDLNRLREEAGKKKQSAKKKKPVAKKKATSKTAKKKKKAE